VRAFIDRHRHVYGVEPICRVMQVAPSGYWRYAAQQRNPALRCARVQRDDVLSVDIARVWQANLQVYGADKVWRQLRREGTDVARCTVERLMRKAGLRGVMRGKVVRTTVAAAKAPCPLDRVNRQFKAQRPNQLWVSEIVCTQMTKTDMFAARAGRNHIADLDFGVFDDDPVDQQFDQLALLFEAGIG
jgi:putative transposase